MSIFRARGLITSRDYPVYFLEAFNSSKRRWEFFISYDDDISARLFDYGLSKFSIGSIYDSEYFYPNEGTAWCSSNGHDVVHAASCLFDDPEGRFYAYTEGDWKKGS